eukprot:Hpha_TRINITY_DN6744_c0_g1::TRINITY_DN6744_c0_g1_i1::g.110986::m.110986
MMRAPPDVRGVERVESIVESRASGWGQDADNHLLVMPRGSVSNSRGRAEHPQRKRGRGASPSPTGEGVQRQRSEKAFYSPSRVDERIMLQHLHWRSARQAAEDEVIRREILDVFTWAVPAVIEIDVEPSSEGPHEPRLYFAVDPRVEVGHFLGLVAAELPAVGGRRLRCRFAQLYETEGVAEGVRVSETSHVLGWSQVSGRTTVGELWQGGLLAAAVTDAGERDQGSCARLCLFSALLPAYGAILLPVLVATQAEAIRSRHSSAEVQRRRPGSWAIGVTYFVGQLVLPYMLQVWSGHNFGWAVPCGVVLWAPLLLGDLLDNTFDGPTLVYATRSEKSPWWPAEGYTPPQTTWWLEEVLSVVYAVLRPLQLSAMVLVSSPPDGISWPWSNSRGLRAVLGVTILELRPAFGDNSWCWGGGSECGAASDASEDAAFTIAVIACMAWYLLGGALAAGILVDPKSQQAHTFKRFGEASRILFADILWLPLLRTLLQQIASTRGDRPTDSMFIGSVALFTYFPSAGLFHTLTRGRGFPRWSQQGGIAHSLDKILVYVLVCLETLTMHDSWGKWTWLSFSLFAVCTHFAWVLGSRPFAHRAAGALHVATGAWAVIPWVLAAIQESANFSTLPCSFLLGGFWSLCIIVPGVYAFYRWGSLLSPPPLHTSLGSRVQHRVWVVTPSTELVARTVRLPATSVEALWGDLLAAQGTQSTLGGGSEGRSPGSGPEGTPVSPAPGSYSRTPLPDSWVPGQVAPQQGRLPTQQSVLGNGQQRSPAAAGAYLTGQKGNIYTSVRNPSAQSTLLHQPSVQSGGSFDCVHVPEWD